MCQTRNPPLIPAFEDPYELVTVAALRRLTGWHVVTLRRWVAEGRIPAPDYRSGRLFLWYARSLKHWLENCGCASANNSAKAAAAETGSRIPSAGPAHRVLEGAT
jgi:hypothetical protein